jgi:hypothetical protein
MELTIRILAYALHWAMATAFLLLALWVMVKIQKLQYTVLGLAISASIASGLDLIPFVGHYLALAVLWICLTRVTREDFTGVVFTAAVSYALVFGMNLFVLGALMGDLRPSVRARTARGIEVPPPIASPKNARTAPPAPAPREQPKALPAATKPPEPPIQKKPSDFHPEKVFVVKGLTRNGKESMAMLAAGGKTYTLALGETIDVDTIEGKKSVRLDNVDKGSILLDVAGDPVTLAANPIR